MQCFPIGAEVLQGMCRYKAWSRCRGASHSLFYGYASKRLVRAAGSDEAALFVLQSGVL